MHNVQSFKSLTIMQKKLQLTADTPLSALFRENHYEELRTVIESWRPFLVGDNPNVDALEMTHFGFNFTRIRQHSVYRPLALLIKHDALIPPATVLAQFLVDHTNLAQKPATVYRQLSRYCQHYG